MIKGAKLGKEVWIAQSADVVGNVEIGDETSVWYHATIRGDINKIKIGAGSNIQDGAVIHVDVKHPCTIGAMTSVGHNATLHGCTVGNRTTIGMGAIVLNGAVIGDNCIIGAGSLVTEGMEIPSGHLAFGSPARIIRELTPEEIEKNETNAMMYMMIKTMQ